MEVKVSSFLRKKIQWQFLRQKKVQTRCVVKAVDYLNHYITEHSLLRFCLISFIYYVA